MKKPYSEGISKLSRQFPPGFLVVFLAACVPAAAQLSPTEPDPLARIREAAKTNVQACSATDATLCEQVAPKIVANAEGDSPLAENVQRLAENLRARMSGKPSEPSGVALAVAAFRDAGVEVHTEKYDVPQEGSARAEFRQENVVAEIRGREKPDEWVLLGAHLNLSGPATSAAGGPSNAAVVIEAARDIQLTGARPRRSIRFVLFDGEGLGMTGSWAYVQAHRNELDHECAAILILAGDSHVDGFELNGRGDIESGVREAVKPIESLGGTHTALSAPVEMESFDFVVEGVPVVIATNLAGDPRRSYALRISTKIDINELKRNTAIAAVTTFGIAERTAPLGPRQTRAEVGSLLKSTGLEQSMKSSGLWPLWESGERGRLP